MQLSAFVDGELPANEAELLLRRMGQDAELRLEVAEYLAIGRLIRAEAGLSGADRLYERVAEAIGDHHTVDAGDAAHASAAGSGSRAVRPMVGFAIAATVALIAIFSLQQTSDDLTPAEPPSLAVNTESTNGVPSVDSQLEKQRVLFRKHAETSSQFGTTGLISQVVTLNFSEELIDDPDADDAESAMDNDVPGDDSPDTEQANQP